MANIGQVRKSLFHSNTWKQRTVDIAVDLSDVEVTCVVGPESAHRGVSGAPPCSLPPWLSRLWPPCPHRPSPCQTLPLPLPLTPAQECWVIRVARCPSWCVASSAPVSANDTHNMAQLDWLIELKFCVRVNTKQVILETFPSQCLGMVWKNKT